MCGMTHSVKELSVFAEFMLGHNLDSEANSSLGCPTQVGVLGHHILGLSYRTEWS